MKCHVSKRELLALCSFVVPKPTQNLEQAHIRMGAWEALGCVELAGRVADLATFNSPIDPTPWVDRAPFLVDLSVPIVDFLLRQLDGEVPGIFSEVLRPLQDRLISVRDKTYKVPQELRPSKPVIVKDEPPAE